MFFLCGKGHRHRDPLEIYHDSSKPIVSSIWAVSIAHFERARHLQHIRCCVHLSIIESHLTPRSVFIQTVDVSIKMTWSFICLNKDTLLFKKKKIWSTRLFEKKNLSQLVCNEIQVPNFCNEIKLKKYEMRALEIKSTNHILWFSL